jgi:E1-E2 ATPase
VRREWSRGEAVVCATGGATEFGRIARLTQAQRERPSPLQRELARVTRFVTVLAEGVILVSLIYVAPLASVFGRAPLDPRHWRPRKLPAAVVHQRRASQGRIPPFLVTQSAPLPCPVLIGRNFYRPAPSVRLPEITARTLLNCSSKTVESGRERSRMGVAIGVRNRSCADGAAATSPKGGIDGDQEAFG